MKLWSWQTKNFSPCAGFVDSTKGEYWQDTPTIRPAYRKLWKVLETDQIVWAYANRVEFYLRPDRRMDVWIIDAPRSGILKLVDSLRWEQYVHGKLSPRDTDFSDMFVESIINEDASAIIRHPVPSEWVINTHSYVGEGKSVLPPVV